jgi:hypothetical protein
MTRFATEPDANNPRPSWPAEPAHASCAQPKRAAGRIVSPLGSLKCNKVEPLSLFNSIVPDDLRRDSPRFATSIRLATVVTSYLHSSGHITKIDFKSPEWNKGIAAAHTDQASPQRHPEANAMTGGQPFGRFAIGRQGDRLCQAS